MAEIIYDMPFSEYLQAPAISRGDLVQIAQCPHRWRYGQKADDSAAKSLGSLAHCVALEGLESAIDRYAVVVDTVRRNSKEWHAEQDAAPGMTLVKESEWQDAVALSSAIEKHATASHLVKDKAHNEVSFFWEIDGIACKARADIISPKWYTMADFKTAVNASVSGFCASIRSYHYDVQAAYYLDGWRQQKNAPELDNFVFIVVEKGSLEIAVYRISPETMQRGREFYRHALEIYRKCSETDYWPSYNNEEIIDV